MLGKSVILLVVICDVSCQINGEFWWLNKGITNLNHGTAPPPIFDDVNELDTDETAKVIFRDSEGIKGKSIKNDQETINAIHFRDDTELAKPIFQFNQLNTNHKLWEGPPKKFNVKKNDSLQNNDDEFRFVFPSDDDTLWKTKHNSRKTNTERTENKLETANKISSTSISPVTKNLFLPENICTFIEKSECIYNEGTLYEPWIKSNVKMNLPNKQVICCILPITTTAITKIIFPDNYFGPKRNKRSNSEKNPGLKQRNNLMSRKYAPNNQKVGVTTPSARKKVTQKYDSDEYTKDPYWNIKNSNIRNPNIPTYKDPDTDYDYESQSYDDDYTVELPKPGLIGLYSDHKQIQSTWMHNDNKGFSYDTSDSVEEEEFETPFGYSTIDPRRDQRLTTMVSKPFRRNPIKLTATSSQKAKPLGLQNPTISFHSNPDFQILQGFKLLNLVRSKNRFVRKTTEINKECVDKGSAVHQNPPKLINYLDKNHEHDVFETKNKQKLFMDCGRTIKRHYLCESGREQGTVEFGEHPWIALVVLTKSENTILCYATIVHSRVAVSVADCVHGKSPGAVSIIAGVRNLDEDLGHSQRRMATVTLDSEYTPGNLEHNLALLHWLRPLMFDATIQTACLAEPRSHNTCVFVGWGGYDQEMHSELRWQRASIVAPQKCDELLSKLEVSDALCAAVESRGTVTGVVGPLLCKSDDNWSAAGVAVWRDDVVILLPLRDWVMKNMISLHIQ